MSEEDYKILKKKRGGVKRNLTQLKTFISNIKFDKENSELNNKNEFLVSKKLSLLLQCENNYRMIHEQLIEVAAQLEAENLCDTVEDDFMEFQNSYFETEYLFSSFIKDCEISKKSHSENIVSNFSVSENNRIEKGAVETVTTVSDQQLSKEADIKGKPNLLSIITDSNSSLPCDMVKNEDVLPYNSIRLPKMSLPNFDGNLQDWLGFRDSFNDLIIANPTLTNIQRFFYLNGMLTGDAKVTIANVEVSSQGFDLAWAALKSKYDDKKAIMENHFYLFFNLKTIVKENRNDIVRLLDDSQKHIRALGKLGEKLSDAVIVFTVKNRFDSETRKLWENEDVTDTLPSWSKMIDFLNRRCRALISTNNTVNNSESSNQGRRNSSDQSNRNRRSPPDNSTRAFVATNEPEKPVYRPVCYLCNESHQMIECSQFINQTPEQRFETTKRFNLCIKCFRGFHRVADCRGPNCRRCSGRHNTLLHLERKSNNDVKSTSDSNGSAFVSVQSQSQIENEDYLEPQTQTSLFCNESIRSQTVLPTAVILISDAGGNHHECRALLDSASQSNFITAELAEKLSIPRQKMDFLICALNGLSTKLAQKMNARILSRNSNFTIESEFLIVPQIAQNLPNFSFDVDWKSCLPPHVKLADPSFNVMSKVDILLGVDVFYKIIENQSVQLSPNSPFLNKTAFGWVVGGRFDNCISSFVSINENQDEESLNELIQKFWVIESLESKSTLSNEERDCEDIFEKSCRRIDSGRFLVHLPLRENAIDRLGDSRSQAMKRFLYLESKFRKNPQLKIKYSEFMNEYEQLGHMKVCKPSDALKTGKEYFLPHHSVMKDSKIRVVFDASAKTSTGVSLNDVLMVGPVVQPDLFSIILDFRKFAYVFTTDIEKMYRQILIHPDHRPLQKILWRQSEDQPIKEYELQTVTYGTSSAPYLATKCLVQLANEEKHRFPLAAAATLNHFYVDDLLCGSDNIEEAVRIQAELIEMLRNAGMNLRKWSSNTPALLAAIPAEDRVVAEGSNETIKTLGLTWNPSNDYFKFFVTSISCPSPSTKRQVLSSIAKLFDPLGLISPVIVTAKILMQQIWVSKVGWDELLPTHLQIAWDKFVEELPMINSIQLERRMMFSSAESTELHGYSDASNVAYGACIYLRSVNANGQVIVKLVCSKSRVSPLSTTSIPRLELNGALLLSKLVNKVASTLNVSNNRITLWTDSSIVLSWIRLPPNRLKTYVANRISEIQETTKSMVWRHVDSKNNVADLLSRGVLPGELRVHSEWFDGPQYLKSSEDHWPRKFIEIKQVPEIKTKLLTLVSFQKQFDDVLNIEKFNSFLKLIRQIAWCRRIWHYHTTRDKSLVKTGELDPADLSAATKCAARIVQRSQFSSELTSLMNLKEVNSKSKLLRLTPFVDKEVLLRVGGRLSNSKSFSMDQKHQILLADHHITRLLVKHLHLENLHSGVQQTLSIVRQKYWILHGKNVVKRVIHFCLPCFKLNPKTMTQLMGELPEDRFDLTKPFAVTGIDFCGPFAVRYRNMRKVTYDKVYVCIFVCFSTKAVHLEVVEDLSADAFLACLRRFLSRRGNCFRLWSDNGTNFVGACNKMLHLHKMFVEKNHDICSFCSTKGVEWKFIPPSAPHFGGIWESGVKVIKTHMKKVIGSAVLTLEYLNTLIVQIEGVMNSRPLTQMSSDPNDLEPITPGHFLTGSAINTILEPDITTLPTNRLTHWQRITQMVQLFEKRFREEYINTLQQRDKWMKPQRNLQCNDIVIVKEDRLPSTQWLVGRIQEVIAGNDGYVRCAIVRTTNGCYKRPITKLARLPVNDINLDILN